MTVFVSHVIANVCHVTVIMCIVHVQTIIVSETSPSLFNGSNVRYNYNVDV